MSNANPNRTEFPAGSWVLAEYHSSIIRKGPPSKLNTQLRGPYKVLRHELDEYTVRNSVTRKDETIHISLLRPFLFDANFIDPTVAVPVTAALFETTRALRVFVPVKVALFETTRALRVAVPVNVALFEITSALVVSVPVV